MKSYSFLFLILIVLFSCKSEQATKNELWIYTSMYKDTIADMKPRLEKAFPGVTFNFFQAGSEEIAAKVNAEILSGGTNADVLISSDRFWYEEMAAQGQLESYQNQKWSEVDSQLKHDGGFYSTVSVPVMVMAYNSEAFKNSEVPSSFEQMSKPEWKDKFTTGSPLASGTNFTTMAMLQDKYGWDYFKSLKSNNTIAQGGNSSVIRRIQSQERPVGWVLLENLLRFKGKDDRLKIVYPKDGVVIQSNVMAITKKSDDRSLAKKFVDWMYTQEGQECMTRSFMYSPLTSIAAPEGAPDFSTLLKNSIPWTKSFIDRVTKERSQLKEEYTKIMFQ